MTSSSTSELSDLSRSSSDESSSAQKKEDISIEPAGLEAGKTTDTDVETGEGNEHSDLPRADGGRKAWLFLAGCFVFEALVWGKSTNPSLPSSPF
jgi:hypothetical protein